MRFGLDALERLDGRVALITGANGGLGRELAAGLARRGARVWMACRSAERAEAARAELARRVPGGRFALVALDLADPASVRACAEEVARRAGRLDRLVLNAGVMAVPRGHTAWGGEVQWSVNHLGHFALAARLAPLLRAAPAARVVAVTSLWYRVGRVDPADPLGERWPGAWRAYARSKLANLLFALELDRRARAAGWPVAGLAAHPGFADTGLHVVGARERGWSFAAWAMGLGSRLFAQPAGQGAWPILVAVAHPAARGGGLWGPGGMLHLRGQPVEERIRGAARDRGLAARLWEASEEAAGTSFGLPPAA